MPLLPDLWNCPACGTPLDENWCSGCEREVSDAEIAEHERTWGELWTTVAGEYSPG
jgi:hypothetical protein